MALPSSKYGYVKNVIKRAINKSLEEKKMAKRKPRKKTKDKMTVSIDRHVLEEFDKFLTEKRTRSRFIEGMLRQLLSKLDDAQQRLIQNEYQCHKCGSHWRTNRPDDPSFRPCRNRYCEGEVEYLGIYTEENEVEVIQ